MYFEDGTIVREQNRADDPGRYGDSCFDSCAFGLSWLRSKKNAHPSIDVGQFFDEKGETRRHPKSIWPEMSQDQELPLYMLCRELGRKDLTRLIERGLIRRGWKTSNDKPITLAYAAEVCDWQWLRCLSQVVQVMFFWFPFYWDDGRFAKGEWPIGNNWRRSDGYLQFKLIAYKTPWPFNSLVRKATVDEKIRAYYKPESDATQVIDNGVILIALTN
jgi:hypothetical protein